ncbi:hypothetical protein A2899_04750 [Candidatus Amesbacteria bacterium RIFCSPLOWO2_01_FULL_49_25]|uniref:TNase-like domain-containing protein n=1 Tax=Candidatus Amesbacteria bacterium RIFCSPHIGHO2_01_FULL_48_32b TaxID=1797253 RepID=A0A1F4YDY8_9BACT|nr:MAG: hypothetical protein A2876_01730 [Candidatus Amesbacteria bacterium RIFCSPHIGHO2_01_FULL_48_32b]OGD07284.1 MAG: hypothetical protein A2899_04750 [Candidatus Amesbacteria bacterium RIFCSPLOWO2_01_FULL_49_25]
MTKLHGLAVFLAGSLVTLLIIFLWPKVPTSPTAVQPTPASSPTSTSPNLVQITNVIDGDTVRLSTGKVVRLIGIDTPEIGGRGGCFGQEASQKANELLQGQYVRLEKDVSETDRYNRLLRYVWKGDELVNETLVAQGFAAVSTFPPDVKYQDRFLAAQKAAREANLGLWSACVGSPKPTAKATPPTSSPPASGTYTCDCSKTCSNLSCAEAQYQLTVCGCSVRDADGDGIACDSQCQ